MTISRDNGFGEVRTYEVVDKIPSGYGVWNIPRKGMEGYLPICQCYPGTYSVILETLKAIPMPEADAVALTHAKGLYGVDTMKKALSLVKRAKTTDRADYFTKIADILQKYTA